MAKLITALVLLTMPGEKPSPKSLETARKAFESLGFDVTEIAGGNLSITAKPTVFGKAFKIDVSIKRILKSREQPEPSQGPILDLAVLPLSLRNIVRGIEFEKGLDFGPENY
jgi:hypothetical protein